MFDIEDRIVDKYRLSSELLSRIHQARDWDLEPITAALNDDLVRAGRVFSVEQVYPLIVRFGKCDYELAKLLEIEFRKFVTITLITPGIPHAPAGAIDMYWHFFILHTELYADFCQEVWGGFKGDRKYRHHFPANDETRAGMLRSYWNTLDTYRDVFGEPEPFERPGAAPIKIWTDRSTTSGDSYSGIVQPGDPLSAQDLRHLSEDAL